MLTLTGGRNTIPFSNKAIAYIITISERNSIPKVSVIAIVNSNTIEFMCRGSFITRHTLAIIITVIKIKEVNASIIQCQLLIAKDCYTN